MATYSALPATLNLVATVGNDFTLSLTVTENGSSWVSTGATLATDIIDSSGTVVATDFTTAASTGTVSLSLTDTQTTTLGVGVYSYRLSVTKSSLTRDWIAGTLSIVEAGQGGTSTSSASLSISNSAVTLSLTSLVAPLAENISVADAGGYYTGTTVEAVLGEIGSQSALLAGLYLDGTSANKLSTPDAAALDVTDLDLSACVAPDAWVAGQINVIAAKYNTSVSWQFYISTAGNLVLLWSANGSTVAATITSSVVIPNVTDGSFLWVRATLDADNGASGYTVKFYTAPGYTDPEVIPPASAWVQFGTTTTGGATTTVFAGTSSMEFGSINGSATGGFKGTLGRFIQRGSIDGAIVADCKAYTHDETPWKITSMTITDPATRVWTLTGTTFEWRRAPRPTSLPIFGFTGDSLTTGVGVNIQSSAWYAQMQRTMSTRHRMKLTAKSSRTLATALTEDLTLLDGALTGTGEGYAFGWVGTNDLNAGTAAATVIANYQTWCENRRTAGWNVIAYTILPRTDAGFNAGFEAGRQAFNTSIRANWATYADALVDVAADTRIGDAGDELDTTYYNADKVHMTATGYGVIKDLTKAQLFSVFGVE